MKEQHSYTMILWLIASLLFLILISLASLGREISSEMMYLRSNIPSATEIAGACKR